MPETPGSHQRDASVDVIRGAAILMLLVLHAVLMTPGIEGRPWLFILASRLSVGVPIFFVLSGFVITAAFERGMKAGRPMWTFFAHRAAKMVPLYLIFLHLNIAFFFLAGHLVDAPSFFRNSVSSGNLTWMNYGIHLAFLQGFSGNLVHTLQDGSWSIVCEVYFYILFPLVLHRFTRTPAAAMYGFFGSLLLSILVTMTSRHSNGIGYYGFFNHLPCFALGIYAYRLRERLSLPELGRSHRRAVLLAAGVLFFGFAKAQTAPLGMHVLYAVFAMMLLLWAPVQGGGRLANLLISMGRQSYALFLGHILVLKVVFTLIVSRQDSFGFPAMLALNLVASVGLAWFLSSKLFDPIDLWCVRRMSQWLGERPVGPPVLP